MRRTIAIREAGAPCGTVARIRGVAATFLLGLLTLFLLTLLGMRVWAHQDPNTCDSTGVSLLVEVFRADQVTPIALNEFATDCETVCVRAKLVKPLGEAVCAFEGGTIDIELPDGTLVPVTPAGGIPCLGGEIVPFCDGELEVFSDFACFTVQPGDIVNERVVVMAKYADGDVHTRPGCS